MTDATEYLAQLLDAKAAVDSALAITQSELDRLNGIMRTVDETLALLPKLQSQTNAILVRQAQVGQDPLATAQVRKVRNQVNLVRDNHAKLVELHAATLARHEEIKSLAALAAELVGEAQAAVDLENSK